MDILQTIRKDYQNFPADQTYSLYSNNVFFKDPLTQFRGIKRYQAMIRFIKRSFLNPELQLHSIQQTDNQIETRWTLSWNAPLPWKPHITIQGWSQLELNTDQQICSHIDYWNCSRFDVLKQIIPQKSR